MHHPLRTHSVRRGNWERLLARTERRKRRKFSCAQLVQHRMSFSERDFLRVDSFTYETKNWRDSPSDDHARIVELKLLSSELFPKGTRVVIAAGLRFSVSVQFNWLIYALAVDWTFPKFLTEKNWSGSREFEGMSFACNRGNLPKAFEFSERSRSRTGSTSHLSPCVKYERVRPRRLSAARSPGEFWNRPKRLIVEGRRARSAGSSSFWRKGRQVTVGAFLKFCRSHERKRGVWEDT